MTSPSRTATAPRRLSRAEQKLRAFHEEGAIAQTYDVRLMARLWPFIRPHGRYVLLSLLTLIVLAGVNLARPLLMGNLVKSATARDPAALMHAGLGLAGLLVLLQTMTFAQIYWMQIAGARAMADLRRHIFLFLQRAALSFFDRTPVGRLVTRVTNDVDAVGELFASGVLNAVGDILSLVGIVAMMLALDVRLSLIAFAALPVVGLVANFVRKRSRQAYREIRTKTARLNSFLNEQVSGIAVVQAYAREEAMAAEFDGINEAYREANKRSIYYEAILDAAVEMIGSLCIASVLFWAGLQRVGAHPVSFATVVIFTQYIKQFFEPVSTLATRYTVLQSAMAGAERIFQLLDEKAVEPPPLLDASCAPAGREDEAFALEGVCFEYKPGTPVLTDVSLTVRRGEKVALVGATGAGKTTVASLALRLYEAKSGVIRVLGKDIRSYEPSVLRSSFSVVPQEVFLFAGSILSNVAMAEAVVARDPSAPLGDEERRKAELALSRVGALGVFERREGGIDAPVDERAANLSAGERQLIAFARAVYHEAPILILDEATASVDSDTEARLQAALQVVMEGRTAIMIAHRLSTIRAADRIVVFHKGRVVETGTHDELLQKGGVYARLHRMQSARSSRRRLG